MYDKDGTKVMVYNVEKWPKKGIEKPRAKKIKKYITKRRTLDSRLDYSSYAEDGFYISFSYFFFQSTHDRYFISRIRLVFFFSTLYKFIVWACWVETQSCLGFKPKLVLTLYDLKVYILFIILNYKNLQFKKFIDDIDINFLFSQIFARIEDIRKYNSIVNLSKFTSNKKNIKIIV